MFKKNTLQLLLLLSTVISTCFLSVAQVHALSGDVHARSLNIPGLGWAGHVGLEAMNGRILEMLDGNPITSGWGYESNLFKNNDMDFRTSSQYWGSRYWKYLFDNQFWRISNYVLRNADYIEDIGAEYTFTARHHHPYNYIDENNRLRVQTGKYRCDTYIYSMYMTGGIRFPFYTILPRKVFYAFPDISHGSWPNRK